MGGAPWYNDLSNRLWPQSKFELQLQHDIYFQTNTLGKGMKPFIAPAKA